MAALSRREILDVLSDFDGTGGASLELLAWETGCAVELARPLWEQLITAKLIDPAGRDGVLGESLYRLSLAGWATLGRRPPRAIVRPRAVGRPQQRRHA